MINAMINAIILISFVCSVPNKLDTRKIYKCIHITYKLLLHYLSDFSTIFNSNAD